MGYTFYGGYMEDVISDYEMRQEDDLGDTFPDFNADKYLDDPRHGQAYYLNNGNC